VRPIAVRPGVLHHSVNRRPDRRAHRVGDVYPIVEPGLLRRTAEARPVYPGVVFVTAKAARHRAGRRPDAAAGSGVAGGVATAVATA
ncbi:hypothetical protein RZS08_01415, partial [Arthrospira platensis SPKY1]|nr:hypothetical protein [Arthrospira platensis SPKY1]